jgi:hypothetical protein
MDALVPHQLAQLRRLVKFKDICGVVAKASGSMMSPVLVQRQSRKRDTSAHTGYTYMIAFWLSIPIGFERYVVGQDHFWHCNGGLADACLERLT